MFKCDYIGGASKYLGSETTDSKDSNSDVTSSSTTAAFDAMIASGRRLAVTTWNIAAINNNPFEYWITYKENPDYENLMINIELFLETPGDKDVPVKEVFTEDMFSKLDARLTGVGWTSVRSYWESDFQNRKIVSGFLKVRPCERNFMDDGSRNTVEAKAHSNLPTFILSF